MPAKFYIPTETFRRPRGTFIRDVSALKKRVRSFSGLLLIVGFATCLLAQNKPTYAGDDFRTGWYPTQAGLSPAAVSSSVFGKIFDTPISGQVYAQPLVYENIVLVATEANWIYGLDALDGSVQWSRNLGPAWNTTDLGCSDLTPTIGISSTPVVDSTSGTAFFLKKTYLDGTSGPAAYFMHAIDVLTGIERANFPVQITGNAQNDPASSFNATFLMNRVSLLLMNNVVYAGFGGMCDIQPFKGWVVGISTTGQIKALWTASPGLSGAGIWQSGGALVSDGPGRIFFATGNGYASSPNGTFSSASVPQGLAQSIVRLAVQPDGSLRADNFFSPYDAPELDGWDADLGSGAPTALPDAYFGTADFPHLLIHCGKQGYVYLLNRDDLGGQRMGPGGADAVLGRIGPYGGVWSRPAVWPGDGGHIFLVSASSSTSPSPSGGQLRAYRYGLNGMGNPVVSFEASSTEPFGSYSSSPVITSDGTNSGSALVWIVEEPDGSGYNSKLMAYDALPLNGSLNLRFSAPVGQATKFTPPGVGPSRIYVGTRDGHVLGFGIPARLAVTAPLTQFGAVYLGNSSTARVTLTANTDVTIQSITTSTPEFQIGKLSLPLALQQGDSLSVLITFTPTKAALSNSTLHVITNLGPLDFSLAGRGTNPGPQLQAFPSVLSLGGTFLGGSLTGNVMLTNSGGQALVIQNISPPAQPFSVSGAPTSPVTLGPGQTMSVTIQFRPNATGTFTDALRVNSSAGAVVVNLSAAATLPGALSVIGQNLNFGNVGLGSTNTLNFIVANTGAFPLTITKTKPPNLGQFTAATQLPEGTVLQPGESRQIGVTFAPKAEGDFSDGWVLNSDTTTGLVIVTLNGTGVATTGMLSASVNATAASVNLTSEGTLDWQHFGNAAQKAAVNSQIHYAVLGKTGAQIFAGDHRTQSWTDGTPMRTADGETSGLYTYGVGTGFLITAPADQIARTLHLHVGGWSSGGTLVAQVSDGSSPVYIDTVPAGRGSYLRDYTLSYQAASNGQSVTVTWMMTSPYAGGNVTLSSAALDGPPIAAGWVSMISKNSGKCAEVRDASLDELAPLDQGTCVGQDNQQFLFTAVAGGYEITVKHSGLQLDVEGGPNAISDGAQIVQYPYWGGSNEVFTLTLMDDGSYEVIAKNSGKCVDVSEVSVADGAPLHQWSCFTLPNQRWILWPVGSSK
jgi:hypothetical protein